MFFYLFMINDEISFLDRLRISSFNVISILSGTGYVTDDFSLWGKFALIFFFIFNVYRWMCWVDCMWNQDIQTSDVIVVCD